MRSHMRFLPALIVRFRASPCRRSCAGSRLRGAERHIGDRRGERDARENLDPANATNSTVDQLLIGVYDALVQFKAGATEPTPQLAKSWTISDDGLTYTFTLRDDVVFHDGSKLTAADVKFTIDRLKAARPMS